MRKKKKSPGLIKDSRVLFFFSFLLSMKQMGIIFREFRIHTHTHSLQFFLLGLLRQWHSGISRGQTRFEISSPFHRNRLQCLIYRVRLISTLRPLWKNFLCVSAGSFRATKVKYATRQFLLFHPPFYFPTCKWREFYLNCLHLSFFLFHFG